MKLIENTIGENQLEISTSNADLEDNMATCDLETMSDVDQSKKGSSSEKAILDKVVKTSKLSNGICNSPLKQNGFLDDTCDEDFQLVLESSSEDGGSPIKKIYDDAISAPQIVQEIEDLLGIDANSVGIDEELEKDLVLLDDSEKEEDIVEESPVTSVISHVSEEVIKKSDEVLLSSKVVNKDNNCELNKSEETECDSSSNMNLVYDEVEIDMENIEVANIEGLSECNEDLIQSSSNLDKTIDDVKTAKHGNEEPKNTIDANILQESKEINERESISDEESGKTLKCLGNTLGNNHKVECLSSSLERNSEEQDMPTSQSASSLESSVEWVVLDAVESSEDDVNQREDKSISKEDLKTGNNQNSESTTNTESIPVETKDQLQNTVTTLGPSSLMSSGIPRKRTASNEEEKVDGKKPKLEIKEKDLTHKSCQVLKRPPKQNETAFKRSRLSETDETKIAKDESLTLNEIIEVDGHEQTTIKKEKSEEHLKNSMNTDVKSDNNKNSEITTKIENISVETKDQLEDATINMAIDEESAIKCTKDMNNVLKNEEETVNISDANVSQVDPDDSSTSTKKGFDKMLNEEQIKENESANKSDSNKKCLPKIESDPADLSKLALDKSQPSLKCDKLSEADTDSSAVHSNTVNKQVDVLVVKDNNEENKENVEVGSCSKDILKNESNLKLDSVSKIDVTENKEKTVNAEEVKTKQNQESTPQLESKSKDLITNEEDPKTSEVRKKSSENSNDDTSKVKEIKVKHNGQFKGEKPKSSLKSPFELLTKNLTKQSEHKQLSNMEDAIENVVNKARRHEGSVHLPILKKFHKDQLRRLTRSQLEEVVVIKICEAITDRSDIGQMRLRCKNLEQSNELWKKKAAQFEKQNRELEMVLKRFMNETAHLKKDNQNKMVLPIKVTRSVGLQVVLASSVHGSLVTSRNKTNAESLQRDTSRPSSQQQSQGQKSQPQPIQPKPTSEPQKQKTLTPQAQSSNTGRRLGRSLKVPQSSAPSTSSATPAATPAKISQSNQPAKTPVSKTISTPTKDLEVIDLTDREEKSKTPAPQQTAPVGGAIRVAPSTQVCFVQSNPPSTSTQPMTYLVQKAVQRQQYIVATTSPSPPRPVGTNSTRQPPAVALPVFRAGGQIIPVQTNSPVGVRTSNNTVVSASRPIPPAIRLQSSPLKHPAPLPSTPVLAIKPGLKAPPPKPQLKIAKTVNGIMLSWSMSLTKDIADMAMYQLYAYQEGLQPPNTNLWKKVGDVKALPLPMACTLTQFIDGHKYHFAVRAVDVHGRPGPFSQPNTILLSK